MNKKLVLTLVAVAISAVLVIYLVGGKKESIKSDVATNIEVIPVPVDTPEVDFRDNSVRQEAENMQQTVAKNSLSEEVVELESEQGSEQPQVKYDDDYRNDLLTTFMEDDFEQFLDEKNLQVNRVLCKEAVCDIDFYSRVPLNNDEDLRNERILDIAVKLTDMGLLSEDNNVSDGDDNFENITFKIRMDEGVK